MASSVVAVGHYLPPKRLTNKDLESMLDTNDEWLVQRTGIHERRIAADDVYSSDLAIRAVENLNQRYPQQLEDVDLVITASMTPDNYCPNMSSAVQNHFNLSGCGAIDINTACSGFAYALQLGNGMIASGAAKKVLVIGSDAMSKILDYQDRSTCVLFGDGAGAIILQASKQSDFLSQYSNTDGSGADALYCTGLAQRVGPIHRFITQNGKRVFKWAITNVDQGVKQLLQQANLHIDDIDWFLPHSANERIIQLVCDKIELDRSKAYSTIALTGNTSSASIAISLSHAVAKGKIRKGQKLIIYGFGGGLTQAGAILQLNSLSD